MPLVKVGTLAGLPPGAVMQVEAGEETVAVCNVGGEIHALDGICPHAGGPLGQGALHGTTLVCPWHAWEYDCVTGAHDRDGSIRLAKFRVSVQDGDIFLDLR
jgi:nitrite reductase/ring-hydroxylating ferredoxin subunit